MTAFTQRSPLHSRHLAAGGRMIQFAGWELPVQYRGIREEHLEVRSAVGVFDISHMGQLFVSGPEALSQLNYLLSNQLTALSEGQGQYTFLLNDSGGVIDDLIVYRTEPHTFFLVVNAAKVAEDEEWMRARLPAPTLLRNESTRFAGLAVQGPQSQKIFQTVFGTEPPERNRILTASLPAFSQPLFACGTGYTGEKGFELFCPNNQAEQLWDALIIAGAHPCGLGARDTLRLEMCYPLNGADLSSERTPLQAGLGFFVDLTKTDFIGKQALQAQQKEGLSSKLCAIRVLEKSPPIRPHYPVFADGKQISETTSGALSPSLGCGIALAILPMEYSHPGRELTLGVRQHFYRAQVCSKPFYSKKP